jgi:Flp pilus assembly CpaF family ATPase
VYIERRGKLLELPVRFRDDGHLQHLIEKIVSQAGRRIDESQPIVDARLADGSRVNAIIPPLALDGPCLSIRRFGRHVITQEEMLQSRTLMPAMMKFLAACVQSKTTVLISGGTGSGKTTRSSSPPRRCSSPGAYGDDADLEIPTRVILQQLASAIKLVVQVARLQDGTRKSRASQKSLPPMTIMWSCREVFTF